MGQTLSFSAKPIEIKASPAVVRAVFLNFDSYPKWKPGWSLVPAETGKKPLELKKGDLIQVNMDGKIHHPRVVENSPESFQWEGSIPGIGSGIHQFHFQPSQITPGGTTFVQKEDFRGPAVTVASPFLKGREFDMSPWDNFNADLKKEAERSAATGSS
ncbi:hypothetical protein PG997_010133 [Apiospora hydei]|uniref:Uncharacterized protein n=1 Tax=Apiospora hydei TaxID=1337664 RepID=A0ABR1VZ78_9PEZI